MTAPKHITRKQVPSDDFLRATSLLNQHLSGWWKWCRARYRAARDDDEDLDLLEVIDSGRDLRNMGRALDISADMLRAVQKGAKPPAFKRHLKTIARLERDSLIERACLAPHILSVYRFTSPGDFIGLSKE